jgi:hypothetical protein
MSATTKKVYTGRLNTLSKMQLGSTPDELKKNHKAVIKYLKAINNGTESGNMRVRGMLTAIFWVMPEKYRKSHNPYYKYYQTVLPGTVGGTDKAWVPRAEYESSDSDADSPA